MKKASDEADSPEKEQMRRVDEEFVMGVARGEARCRYTEAKLIGTAPSRTAAF